jgi:O-antigen ligase
MSWRRVKPGKSARLKKLPGFSGQMVALGIFALIVIAGPLAFGAVDRLPQIVMLVLLCIGMLAQPPAIAPLSRWGNAIAIVFVGLLVVKEFAPASWFGEVFWRTTLTRQFSLELPWTHHPEPARALDGLLAGVVAVVWFVWARRLATTREHRAFMVWTLFLSAAVVAIVSFETRHPGPGSVIYEGTRVARLTPGWSGFGPFPNRNHTADFFAMAALLGCGCLAWAGVRRKWLAFGAGAGLLGLVIYALLTTESRGGLIAFAAGLAIYLLLCLCKVRSRRMIGAALGSALIFGVVMFTFGGRVLARFHSHEGGEVSNLTRVGVWHDALGMWHDAPLLGHGLDSFAGIFPLYQTIELENQIVLHPESSWLLWLTELGIVPVIIGLVAATLFLVPQMRGLFARHRSFFLHAGGIAAFAVLLIHGIFDVPAHRWGTAGFALAALAAACPIRLDNRLLREPRVVALVPLAIAVFWCLPIFWFVPAWSPVCLNRLLEMDSRAPMRVPLTELEKASRYFPLNADLHQSIGLRQLRLFGNEGAAQWERQFAIASRLQPGAWEVPMIQARACQKVLPMESLTYWQQAIERGGIHQGDVLGTAVQETARFPSVQPAWGRYVEAHPQLLLTYAKIVPEEIGRYYYGRWWKLRAEAPDVTAAELHSFYGLAPRWGNREDFEEWARRHEGYGMRDYRQWAALLHAWGDDEQAWRLLSNRIDEPIFAIPLPTGATRSSSPWRMG